MRRIFGWSLLGVLTATAAATAQYPGANPWGGNGPTGGYPGQYGGGYGGGYGGSAGAYRGPNAPLSPYLNMLSGGNPATNYYNLVRPNTYSPFRGGGLSPFTGGSGRQSLFPTLRDIDDGDLPSSQKYRPKGETLDRVHMAPTGHPAAYGNTMGYFGPLTAGQGGPGSSGSHGMKPTGTPSGMR